MVVFVYNWSEIESVYLSEYEIYSYHNMESHG